jgi:hypothetical protein
MILDQFTLHSVIVQMVYEDAFIIWDRAGDIARGMSRIWPGLKLVDGQPNQQTLTAPGVQILTGLRTSTFTVRGAKALDQTHTRQINDSCSLLRDSLELENFQRVSARSVYVRKFENIKDANSAVTALGLLKWPNERVFDQPADSDQNGAEILFRFENKTSFTFRPNLIRSFLTSLWSAPSNA